MASPITFGGLASGLDTKSIIAALVAVEGRKVEFLKRSRTDYDRRIAAYGDLATKLGKLQTALETLSDRDSFVAHKTTLSDGGEKNVSALVSGSATTGIWQIGITSLAQSTFVRSSGFADANASLGLSGTLSIQVGATTTNLAVSGTNDSLNGLRDAINASGAEVSATVVFDGTSYHLELRGRETGLANAVTILAEPPGASGPVLNLTQFRAAADAQFTVDGQSYTSASNKVENAIQGVTLQLLDEQAVGAAPVQLTLSEDFEGVQKQLQSFVDAYNDVVKFLNEQSAARASSEENVKPLSGESALRGLRAALSSIAGSSIASTTPGAVIPRHDSLPSLGIRTSSDGTLKLDSAKLKTALADDLDGVVSVFAKATVGVGVRMLAAVKARTSTGAGVIKLRKDSFAQVIRDLEKRIRAAEDSLARFEEGLVRRFSQLEELVGRLQAQGTSLNGITTSFSSRTRR